MPPIEAVRWSPNADGVRIIDQRLLPGEYLERDLHTLDEVCAAIATLAVRGAPAIGVAGAMGLVASLATHTHESGERFRARLAEHASRIRSTRPTAVNLPWAIDRMLDRAAALPDANPLALLGVLRAEATAILDEDRASCRLIGEHGLALIADGARVLTHCNAGALATAGIGTALAPIYLATELGRAVTVYAGETRPLLQGSRLTAWELQRAGVDVRVIADGAAASVMARGEIDLVIVGADRIAANGDAANKIGTYALAVAAHHHDIPFYVAAPESTVDRGIASGAEIVIEARGRDELANAFGRVTVPAGVRVENPAFDVTPAALISAIVTDVRVYRAPYEFGRGVSAVGSNGRAAAIADDRRPTPAAR